MSTGITREPQYQQLLRIRDQKGISRFGLMSNQVWYDDPRRICFTLSRYKFVAKMLSGKSRVLEIGCGDAFATRVVMQEVGAIHAIDFDPIFVQDVNERMDDRWRFDCSVHDILNIHALCGRNQQREYGLEASHGILPEELQFQKVRRMP